MSLDRHTGEPPGSEPSSMVIWNLLDYIADLERRYQALWREHDALLTALWGNDTRQRHHRPASGGCPRRAGADHHPQR